MVKGAYERTMGKKKPLTVRADGLIKEKITQTVDIRCVKHPTDNRNVGFLNVHHSAINYTGNTATTSY